MQKSIESLSGQSGPAFGSQDFRDLVYAVVSGETEKVLRLLASSPDLVRESAAIGASRESFEPYFFNEIRHYLYGGDTALHMAAAGFKWQIAQVLIDKGSDCSAKNRRGAEPLHYASDSNLWNPDAQALTINCLIRAGANPNAIDKSGVVPLHRAVRTRCTAAVQSLLAGGSEPRRKNKSGSTPLHLAVQTTGRSGSGEPQAIEQQRQIILLLLRSGAKRNDRDGRGRTVDEVVKTDWIRELLEAQG